MPLLSTDQNDAVSDGPAPGWYPDPAGPGQLRWWDGRQWTDHRQPSDPMTPFAGSGPPSGPGTGRFRPVGDYFGHIFEMLGDRVGHLFTIVTVTLLPPTVVAWVLAWGALDGVVITVDDDEWDVTGWSDSASVMMIGAAVLVVLGSLWFTTAAQHQLWRAGAGSAVPWSTSLIKGLTAIPRLVGWSLVVVAGVVATVLVLALLVAVSPFFLIVAIPAFVAVIVAIVVYLQFLPVAVVATRTNALRASVSVAQTRFWPTLGRTALGWLVAMAASIALGFVGQIASAIVGVNTNEVVTTSGSLTTFDLGGLLPNVGAAVVTGLVSGLQSGVSQSVSAAAAASLYVDSGAPADPDHDHVSPGANQ